MFNSKWLIFVLILSVTSPGHALAKDEFQSAQDVIQTQLRAFRQGDDATAYDQSSAKLKKAFPSAAIFMKMVRQGYGPLLDGGNLAFGQNGIKDSIIYQEVLLTGPQSKEFSALYSLARQEDCSIKITGVTLARSLITAI